MTFSNSKKEKKVSYALIDASGLDPSMLFMFRNIIYIEVDRHIRQRDCEIRLAGATTSSIFLVSSLRLLIVSMYIYALEHI